MSLISSYTKARLYAGREKGWPMSRRIAKKWAAKAVYEVKAARSTAKRFGG